MRGMFVRLSVISTLASSLGCASKAAAPTATAPAAAPAAAPTSTQMSPAAGTAVSGPRTDVLIFTRTTAFHHESIPTAAAALQQAVAGLGYQAEVTDDPARFTPERLAKAAAVIFVSTTGKPLGDPGTPGLEALDAYVQAGGALVGLHSATSTQYDPAGPLTRLMGAKFINHPGKVRDDACHPQGKFASVAALPSPFMVHDEIYVMDHLRPDNQIDLTCDVFQGSGTLPIAWHRQEGQGRVFYSALGHENVEWSATSPVFRDHIMPGIRWALGR